MTSYTDRHLSLSIVLAYKSTAFLSQHLHPFVWPEEPFSRLKVFTVARRHRYDDGCCYAVLQFWQGGIPLMPNLELEDLKLGTLESSIQMNKLDCRFWYLPTIGIYESCI